MRAGYADASKWVMGPIPLFPSIRARQFSAVPTARGDTRPTPVTTTRRSAGELKILAGLVRRSAARSGSSVLVPGIVLDVVHRLAHVADLLGLLVRDLDAELLLEGHHELDDVQRVCSQVIGEAGLQRDLVLVDAQLLNDNALDPFRYSHGVSLLLLRSRAGRARTAVLTQRRILVQTDDSSDVQAA